MTRNKDYGRRPYLETENDDYKDFMKYRPFSQNTPNHSEFIKPYDERVKDYTGMEALHPGNFKSPELTPSIDTDPGFGQIPSEDPCAEAAKINAMVRFNGSSHATVQCGESVNITMDGGTGKLDVQIIGFDSYGSITGSTYKAPTCKECCEDEDIDNSDILFQVTDECGREVRNSVKLECREMVAGIDYTCEASDKVTCELYFCSLGWFEASNCAYYCNACNIVTDEYCIFCEEVGGLIYLYYNLCGVVCADPLPEPYGCSHGCENSFYAPTTMSLVRKNVFKRQCL